MEELKRLSSKKKLLGTLAKSVGRFKSRVGLIVGVVFFVTVFQAIYVFWLNPIWGYMGFAYEAPPWSYWMLANIAAVLPSLWIPRTVNRPSQLIYWLLYLAVYIPSIFTPLYAALVPLPDVAMLQVSLVVGLGVMGLSYSRPLLNFRRMTESRMTFWFGVVAVTAGFTLWVLVVYSGHFSFVSFSGVYDQLRSAGGALGQGTGVGYATMWLTGAVFPFFMAWSLFKKQKLVFLGAALGELMIYGTAGMKGPVLAILFIPAMYFSLRGKTAPKFGLRLVWFASLLLCGFSLLNGVVGDAALGGADTASSVVVVRAFAIPGLATAHYQKFFTVHPYTYYSHVTGISLLKEYPYEKSLGEEVGFDMYSNGVNWNANFWATDGLAALGIPGVLLISLICGALFWVLDSCARGHDPAFAAVVCSYAAANIGNTSLFTSFVSGGLGFLVILFFFMPRGIEKPSQKVSKESRMPLHPASYLEPSSII